jgi:hypothetical protein
VVQDSDGLIEFPRPISPPDIRSGDSLQERAESLEDASRKESHSTELYHPDGIDVKLTQLMTEFQLLQPLNSLINKRQADLWMRVWMN